MFDLFRPSCGKFAVFVSRRSSRDVHCVQYGYTMPFPRIDLSDFTYAERLMEDVVFSMEVIDVPVTARSVSARMPLAEQEAVEAYLEKRAALFAGKYPGRPT